MAANRKYPVELRERAVRLYRESDPKPVIRRLAGARDVDWPAALLTKQTRSESYSLYALTNKPISLQRRGATPDPVRLMRFNRVHTAGSSTGHDRQIRFACSIRSQRRLPLSLSGG